MPEAQLRNWLWPLDSIQDEMQRLIPDVHFLFGLGLGAGQGTCLDFHTFSMFGFPISMDRRPVVTFLDSESGALWFELDETEERPAFVCWPEKAEPWSLHDSMPAAFFRQMDEPGYFLAAGNWSLLSAHLRFIFREFPWAGVMAGSRGRQAWDGREPAERVSSPARGMSPPSRVCTHCYLVCLIGASVLLPIRLMPHRTYVKS